MFASAFESIGCPCGWVFRPYLVTSEFVGPFGQTVRQLGREIKGLVLVDPVLGDQLREIPTVDAARDVVPRRDRQERARIVVEADGVVKAGGLGGLFAKEQN